MRFLNRRAELDRLDALARRGGLAVVYGRRRIGKTRLLLEWVERHRGIYFVADESSAALQRHYLARAVATRLDGFDAVTYPDWAALFERMAREARAAAFRGPVVVDELPYLVSESKELPSVLQRFVDHDAKQAGLAVALAGSSQRMMQGLALDRSAPLFSRADELLKIEPLGADELSGAFPAWDPPKRAEAFAAFGGIPRYWELAEPLRGSLEDRIDRLMLDPLGPLHREPDRVLLEETPSAMEVRPLLDAIGAGAHRVSEIAGRMGRPATSLSRPLDRLVELGLAVREVPFGEPERSRRSLYRIADPFFRLWFRVVAPNRGMLAGASVTARKRLLRKHWPAVASLGFEDLCRSRLPQVSPRTPLGRRGPWGPASGYWRGSAPEWDVISESLDGQSLLFGEVKWSARAFDSREIDRLVADLEQRPVPELPALYRQRQVHRALFVPDVSHRLGRRSVLVVTAKDLLR